MRDQNTFDPALRKKRLMTLIHLFLIHRYKAAVGALREPDRGQPVPDPEDEASTASSPTSTDEVGQIIVADVNAERVAELLKPDRETLDLLIRKVVPTAGS